MLIVKIENKKQLDVIINRKEVGRIIIQRDSFDEKEISVLINKIKKNKKEAYIMLERISRYEEIKNLRKSTDELLLIDGLDGIVIQNIDSYAYILRKLKSLKNLNLKIELNWTMACYNSETKKIYENLYEEALIGKEKNSLEFTAPVELNMYEINDVKYDTLLIYGYLGIMVAANCLYKNTLKKCNKVENTNYKSNDIYGEKAMSISSYIKDRKNKNLHYKTYCKYCYNIIFNVEPLYLIDILDTLNLKNEYNFRLDFTFENEKEVLDILTKNMPTSFTRGHIKNGIK